MLRLQRVGRKHNPYFRVVVTDKQNSTKSGRFLEVIGSYDARMGTRVIDGARAKHWLAMGAKATDTVHNILVDTKVISAKKINNVHFPVKSAEADHGAGPAKEVGEAKENSAEAPKEKAVEEIKAEISESESAIEVVDNVSTQEETPAP